MLLTAIVIYVPVLSASRSSGDDMIALAFVAMSLATAAVLLIGSVVATLVLRRRGTSRASSKDTLPRRWCSHGPDTSTVGQRRSGFSTRRVRGSSTQPEAAESRNVRVPALPQAFVLTSGR